METLFAIVLVLFFARANALPEGLLQYKIINSFTFSEDFQSYYKYIDKPLNMSWPTVYCAELGSKLFFPESEEEARFALGLLPPEVSEIWIGAGGSPYDNWITLHDVEGGNAQYLRQFMKSGIITPFTYFVMNNHKEYNFKLWEEKLPFICRKQIHPKGFTDERLQQYLQNGYTYDKNFRDLYKYKRLEHAYDGELLYCNYDGGSLYLPGSTDYISILKEMYFDGLIFTGVTNYFDLFSRIVEDDVFSDSDVDWAGKKIVAIDNSGKYQSTNGEGVNGVICKIKLTGTKFNSHITLPIIHDDAPKVPTFYEPLKNDHNLCVPSTVHDEFKDKKYTYLRQFDSYYKLYEGRGHSHWTAALICNSDDSSLLYPNSLKEAQSVFNLVPRNVNKLWIGVMTTPYVKFHTYTDKNTVYLDFTKNYVKNEGIILHRNSTTEYVNNTEQLNFICKKNISLQPYYTDKEKENLMNNGYNFHSNFDAWYKQYNHAKTYEFAFAQCLVDGADLFVPETQKELDEITFDMNISDSIWLGITKLERDYFVTVNGQLASNFYYKWATDEPNFDYDYVALNKAGKYFSASKFQQYAFICKKPAKKYSCSDVKNFVL